MCTNRDIFDAWVSAPDDRFSAVSNLLTPLVKLDAGEDQARNDLQNHVRDICSNINKRWGKCGKRSDRFLEKYHDWLSVKHTFPNRLSSPTDPSNLRTTGRPVKSFEESSAKTKRRKVEDLIKTRSAEELRYAADIAERSSSSGKDTVDSAKCLTPEEALSLYIDLDLTERKYDVLRTTVNAVCQDCFPSVYALRQAKKKVLPETVVTETSAEVNLQDTMNKTVHSISKFVKLEKDTNAKLVCKAGFDGSGGHSTYKQKFENCESTDEYMFLTAFVPLRLIDIDSGESLWTNERPGSTLYCRPIKFVFQKECPELVKNEESDVLRKAAHLVDCTENVGEHILQVCFEFHLTMVDGSVCNTLSDTNSSATCYICGATPKTMNSVNCSQRVPNENNYRFGLSSLHLWIRLFECLLHIAYRLSFKKWRASGADDKALMDKEKRRIQSEFKSKMGLIVDQPKQGFGCSNDGNTARRFFADPNLSSEITRIDVTLIDKLYLILRILASGLEIKLDVFEVLLSETKELYLNLYSWFYMPCTLHKLLFHGIKIMQNFDLPIGQFTEEALEASHKIFRRTRLHHSRKSSRAFNCQDVMNHMLLMSDPFISSNRKIVKNTREIDPEIENFVVSDMGNESST